VEELVEEPDEEAVAIRSFDKSRIKTSGS